MLLDHLKRPESSSNLASAVFPFFDITGVEEYTRLGLSGRTVHCYFRKNCGARSIHIADGKCQFVSKGGIF